MLRYLSRNPSYFCSDRQIFSNVCQNCRRGKGRRIVVDVFDVDGDADRSGQLRRAGVDGRHSQLNDVAGFAIETAGQREVAGVRIEVKLNRNIKD